ncbi:MAG: hypothetical protein ACLU38_06460 [Dysosmobacter sp.]
MRASASGPSPLPATVCPRGQVVKVSGSGTVAKCADNDGFEGVVLSVARDGKACSVAMGAW